MDYIKHLQKRNYRYIVAGDDKVDIKLALDLLSEQFGVKRILTDTGRVLGNILINLGLVKEISLLIHPLIAGEKCYGMFSDVKEIVNLKLTHSESYDNGCVWITFNL